MSKIYLYLAISSIFISLFNINGTSVEVKNYDYTDVENLHIGYDRLYSQINDHYYVYLYILGCLECNSLKDIVISCALNTSEHIYFLQMNDILQDKTNDFEFKLYFPQLLYLNDNEIMNKFIGYDKILEICNEIS